MFSHKHYVPILKTKAGERWALSNLSPQTRKQLTPLLEIHPHKSKKQNDHIDEICEALASFMGPDDAFFFDPRYTQPAAGVYRTIISTFDSARANNLCAIPVASLAFNQSSIRALKEVIDQDGNGYMLRIERADLLDPNTILAFLKKVGNPAKHVHLMIDYRDKEPNLAVDASKIPVVKDWRTITCASGIFPSSYSTMKRGVWHAIGRSDYAAWRNDITTVAMPRKITFGDYTVRDPGAPADFGEPSVNLRYATRDHWLMQVGGKIKTGASKDIFPICQSLASMSDYSGSTYSVGDKVISEVALRSAGPGNPQQWIQWSVNHHLVFTARQIANDSAL